MYNNLYIHNKFTIVLKMAYNEKNKYKNICFKV